MQYAVVDLEMCRVKRKKNDQNTLLKNELIEIGAVLLNESYEITDRFKTYVCAEYGTIDSYIHKLTGISQKDIQNAPHAKEALESFAQWLPDDVVLVSWSESDEHQIRKEMMHKNISVPKIESLLDSWEDCQKTFAEKTDYHKTYKLSEALIIANINFDENFHDALVDAENTALLFAKMKNEPDLEFISCYATENEDVTMYATIGDLLKDFTFVC